MQFQNSNLKLQCTNIIGTNIIGRKIFLVNRVKMPLSTKNWGLLFHSAFRNISVHVFQFLVVDIVYLTYCWYFFLSGTYCWYCVLEVWVWGMSNNCGAIIVWVSGMAETSMESMDLTLQFLFLSQFHLWWWTLLICMHRP